MDKLETINICTDNIDNKHLFNLNDNNIISFKNTYSDIIIIGSGVAGISACNQLKKYGFSVTILEARSRIGGRIWTDKNDKSSQSCKTNQSNQVNESTSNRDYTLELGAYKIHGIDGNPIYSLAKQNNLKTIGFDYESSCYYNENNKLDDSLKIKLEKASCRFWAYLNKIQKSSKYNEDKENDKAKDSGLNEAIEKYIKEYEVDIENQRLLDNYAYTDIEGSYGNSLKNLSYQWFDEFCDFKGEDHIVPSGYIDVFQPLADKMNIILNTTVTELNQEIYKNKGLITVVTNTGNYYAKFVVCTVPLGYLKQNLIRFVPELSSSKKEAIEKLGFGTLDKIFVEFTAKFWGNENIINIIKKDFSPLTQIINYEPYTNKNVLLIFIAGNRYPIGSKTFQEISYDIINHLKDVYPNAEMMIKNICNSNWANDKYTFGSYSSYAPGSTPDHRECFKEIEGRVVFAGEHTDMDYYQTVQGAWTSGIRAADQINNLKDLNDLKDQKELNKLEVNK